MEQTEAGIDNFRFVAGILWETAEGMLEGVRFGLRHDKLGILPAEKDVNPIFPAFEVFSYLLFQLDFLAATYQEQGIRRRLFHFVADKIQEILPTKRKVFNSILDRRMQEYGGIQVDESLTDDSRRRKLLQGFLDNLTYAISKQDLFCWEGKTKPLPLTDADELLVIHAIYQHNLRPAEINFRIMLRHVLTGLRLGKRWSETEVHKVTDAAMREVDEISLNEK